MRIKNLLRQVLSVVLLQTSVVLTAAPFHIRKGMPVHVSIAATEPQVVHTAVEILSADMSDVLDASVVTADADWKKADIIIGTVTETSMHDKLAALGVDASAITGKHEAYVLRVTTTGQLLIAGSDKRGTAYGVMTLSRELGVSPWTWWADVPSRKLEDFKRKEGWCVTDSPVVMYRGIFLNDEDWNLMPWSSLTYEPLMRSQHGGNGKGRKGEIGPYTYSRICELLLRLKANTLWPAMHRCTRPFYLVDGNKEVADKYGIIIGTSHCEPMLRNANGEWKSWAGDPKGSKYNYVTNRDSVLLFWQQRVMDMRNSDCIYTIGMRGIHDGKMNGVGGVKDHLKALTAVIKDQRSMLSEYVGDQVPQQFIPYKEVLDCYNAGLEVPDDVTLIWCDDNYGYIRHFPTAAERNRSGGNGVYYHISYLGRPHDYLWLSTTHPELIRSEMLRGYDHGIDRTWIVNVGDIKPGEFETSLFLDMAWNPERFRRDGALEKYADDWYDAQIGFTPQNGWWKSLFKDYYDLSFRFRPEFTTGSRTEEKDPKYRQHNDLPLNEREIRERLAACASLYDRLIAVSKKISPERDAAFFELVEYPVAGMAKMNEKHLTAQLARHGLGAWQPSHDALSLIQKNTERYNSMLDGKWKRMMNKKTYSATVFNPVKETVSDTPMPEGQTGRLVWKSDNVIGRSIHGELMDIKIDAGVSVDKVTVLTLPVHPTEGKQIRYTVSVDGGAPQIIDFHTEGRSEEWKQNVLYNKAVRVIPVSLKKGKSSHTITIGSLDEAVRIQEVYIE